MIDEPFPSPVRVKVCGLTRVDEALACARAGVDWLGLNFHPGSPRRVDPGVALAIIAALPPECEAVGLFVDRPPEEVAETAARLGLRRVQLHGSEPPEDLLALAHLFIIRAYRLGDESAVSHMMADLRRAGELGRLPDALLVDGHLPGLAGGTGQTVALDLLDGLSREIIPPLVLAGGLTPENVAARVARVRPWMVDVASGVEASPGRKDFARVAAFLRAARGNAEGPSPGP